MQVYKEQMQKKKKITNNMIYEYGAMSSKYSIEVDNKLTAYAAMIIQFNSVPQLIAIYSPKESAENDSWLMRTNDLQQRLDEIFGGEGEFMKYLDEHMEEIKKACKTIKKFI